MIARPLSMLPAMLMAFFLAACSTTIDHGDPGQAKARSGLMVKSVKTVVAPGVVAPADLASRLDAAVLQQAAQLSGPGGKPVSLAVTVKSFDVVSEGARFFFGAFAGSNKLDVAVTINDAQSGASLGSYTVQRSANPGGYGAFYDQTQATINETAEGILNGVNPS